MYKCYDKDNPFIMRKGERIVNLDRFVEMLKENNIFNELAFSNCSSIVVSFILPFLPK